ncbi:hypothetical protein MHBO_004467 [Bonamia ostreae]|uniref:Uncharacterized protein n=1 Tax=Bonamia ostreae TaxID=126728 RepID=A0ABV2ATE8_9EUKA
MIKTEKKTGDIDEKDFSGTDITTREGEKCLRDALKPLTDLTVAKDSNEFISVEIAMPVPFLKVYLSLSDCILIPSSFNVYFKSCFNE